MNPYDSASVLIVEDNKDIVDLLKLYLEEYNFNVIIAYNGKEALSLFNDNNVDAILLDIMIPMINGYDVMRQIRMISNVPIIVISSKNMDNEKIIGLNIGADDYIVKPFNPLEVIARLNAQLRRVNKFKQFDNSKEPERIILGDLLLDCSECRLYKNSRTIELTYTEFKLIKLFMGSPGRVFTKKLIFESVWEDEFVFADNTIMVYISRLREKLEEDSKNPKYIKTVRGLGYRIEKE